MTSDDQSKNAYDFEEGEIIDDDEPSNELPVIKTDYKQSGLRKADCRFPSSNSNASRRSEAFRRQTSATNQTRPPYSESRNREAPGFRNFSKKANSRRRQNDLRKSVVTPRVLRKQNIGGRRKIKNSRDRSRGDTPYEEKLRDFQMRQQRVTSNSKPFERKTARPVVMGLVETQTAGTSLLKRLVGSGSVCIKLLDENSSTDQNKFDTRENAVKEKIFPIEVSDKNKYVECNTCDTIVVSDQIENSEEEKKSETPLCSSQDIDDELKLRMEALKTVVMKKHTERLKRGYVPKKISRNLDDSVVDSFIEEVELLHSCSSVDPLDETDCMSSRDDHKNVDNLNNNSSDMSMDSNYISDDDDISNLLPMSSEKSEEVGHCSGIKRTYSYESEVVKKPKIDENFQECGGTSSDNVMSDSNEELELRALALKSFFHRKALKDSDTDSDKASFKSEIADVNYGEDIPRGAGAKTDCVEIKIDRTRNDSDNWEELDEDILRAQLLKTLSANLPGHTVYKDDYVQDDENASKVTATVPAKIEQDIELEIQSKLWSEMMVPKLVISLSSDSESEPEQPQQNFVSKLELLLQEAKEKSEKVSSQIGAIPKVKKKILPKLIPKKPILRKATSGTPLAVKHLPIQQQEEYRRLKMKLAQKMKLNELKSASETAEAGSFAVVDRKINSLNDLPKDYDSSEKGKISTLNLIKHSQNKIVPRSGDGSVNNRSLNVETGSVKHTDGLAGTSKTQLAIAEDKQLGLISPKVVSLTKQKLELEPKVNLIEGTRLSNNCEPIVKKPIVPLVSLKTKNKMIKKLGSDGDTTKQNLKLSSTKVVNKTPLIVVNRNASVVDKSGFNSLKKGINVPDLLNKSSMSDLKKKYTNIFGKSESPVNPEKISTPNISTYKNNFCKTLSVGESKKILKQNSKLVVYKNISSVSPTKPVNLPSQYKPFVESKEKKENSLVENSSCLETKQITVVDKRDEESSANKMEIENALSRKIKDNGGNSDKENEVLKDKIVEKKQEIAERLSSLIPADNEDLDQGLITRLKCAEIEYEDSLAVVLRLEKQLEEAKKIVVAKERVLSELKEKINPLKCPSSMCVKDIEEQHSKHKIVDQAIPRVTENSVISESCWDPDGVLCPFQLAGSCKDPSCIFHHIPTL